MTVIADRYKTIADFISRGNLQHAEQQCRQMLQATNDPELVYILAVIKGHQKEFIAAGALFETAIRSLPNRPDIIYNFGVICQAGGDLERAVALWQYAVNIEPAMKDAHYNLGRALSELKRMDQAEKSYRHALALGPNDGHVLYNLGNLRFQQDDFQEAENLYRRAIEVEPSWSDPWANLGMTLSRQGQYADAEQCYCEALKRNPDNAEAHWNRSITLLLTGNYKEGWQEYEWRFKRAEWKSFYPFSHQAPRWSGHSYQGQTLLVHDEQGLGDTLQFFRYLPMAKSLGGTLIFEVKGKLLALLKHVAGADQVVSRSPEGKLDVDYNFYIPLLSLPALFGTTQQTVPNRVPYLLADNNLTHTWAEKLKSISGFKIGICWQGNPAYKADRQRSVPLKFFAPLARMKNVQLISLQKMHGLEQLEQMQPEMEIIDLGAQLDDGTGVFMDTAAVMKNLDLVITSDTAIPHLAGALGIPVWLLLPYIPDWRWGLSGNQYPWYPTMRIFRQSAPGDWAGLFNTICDAIQEHI